jgi:oligoendopeptidase F
MIQTRLHSEAVPQGFKITSWEVLEPHLLELLNSPINSVEEMGQWLVRVSNWEAQIYEEKAWRHIRVTCQTHDQEAIAAYTQWAEQMMPPVMKMFFRLLQKAVASPFFDALPDQEYEVLKKSFKSQISIFREENVSLQAEASVLARKFDRSMGGLSVEIDGEQCTMAKAVTHLEGADRDKRSKVWDLVMDARATVRDDLHQLLTDLIALRGRVAANAGFPSFTQYAYKMLERHDYGVREAEDFRHAIATVIKPLYEEQLRERRQMLGLEVLKPYDLTADLSGGKPLKPFAGSQELTEKSIRVLTQVNPAFADVIAQMRDQGLLDLESRISKAPGGYNYPLPVTGAPFIFMNATGSWGDVVTMMHEAGHAVHAYLSRNIQLYSCRHVPSEIAELASMSMELLALDALAEFYPDKEELKRAKLEQLSRMIVLLPWIATIDHFQHWIYDHPNHTREERNASWGRIHELYHGNIVDWSDNMETYLHYWQRQGHIFRSPFYYIEYGIAQLGAVAVWRNYKANPKKALRQYADALTMGYTRPMHEVYEAAGIKFDFSEAYIQDLMDFAMGEIRKIKAGN